MGYLDGFRVTFKKLFEERLTRDYSKDEGGKRVKPVRLHGRHVLNRYEDGVEKCIGCELSAGVCPTPAASTYAGADNPPDQPVAPGERYGYIYEINYLRCIHCDLCVEACPTEAITETKLFEFSFTDPQRRHLQPRPGFLVADDGRPQQLPWEDWTDIDDVASHTSAWMRATAPVRGHGLRGPHPVGQQARLRREGGRAGPVRSRSRRDRHGRGRRHLPPHGREPGGADAAHAPAGSQGHDAGDGHDGGAH